MSRAHHTAWPSPRGCCWRFEAVQIGDQRVVFLDLAARLEGRLELEGEVEMVLDDPLVAACDEDEMLDPGVLGLVDDVLENRAVDDRHHLLGHRLGGRQEPGPQSSHGKHRLANAFHARSINLGTVVKP